MGVALNPRDTHRHFGKRLYCDPVPRAVFRGQGVAVLPSVTFPQLRLHLGSRGREPSHLAPLGAILLEEVTELGTGCPLAGAPAQAFRGHLLDPAI